MLLLGKMDTEALLDILRSIDPFPEKKGRKKIMQPGQQSVQGFALKMVRCFKDGLVCSRFNAKFPKLLKEAKKVLRKHDSNFRFTTIQVNKNQLCPRHRDANNTSMSYIIGLGDYQGGGLVVIDDKTGEEKTLDIKNKFVRFDARKLHYTEPFEGERYTLAFFSLKKR